MFSRLGFPLYVSILSFGKQSFYKETDVQVEAGVPYFSYKTEAQNSLSCYLSLDSRTAGTLELSSSPFIHLMN